MTPEMEAELNKSLGSIVATLQRIEKGLDAHVVATDKKFNHMNGRVRGVESKINWAGGATAVVGGIAALVFGGFYK